ncbi:MAG: helix-turn-helix transcriptional regulator [Clostridia bacterium]|nr:helix-turn-helix transcriptional regulator [Clostridia bacterium]
MEHYKIEGIPGIVFAHKFSADSYSGCIPASEHRTEITLITSGSLDMTVGGVTETAREGDICCNFGKAPLYVNAGQPHSHHTVCFDLVMSRVDQGGHLRGIPLITRSCEETKELGVLIDEIIRLHTIYPDDKLRSAGVFLQLLSGLDGIDNSQQGVSFGERLYAEKAKEYIYEHIYEPVSQRAVAEHLGITPEYLCAVFRKAAGSPFIRFCNEVKLESIRTLIETKNIPLSQASLQYGYSDPNYVSRLYKKYHGVNITEAVRFGKTLVK